MIDIKLEGKEVAKSVCDLFSPLTELSGAIGDHIKIYRKLSVLKALKRAKNIAEKDNLQLETPPLKFLIPYLENVSLEEEKNDTLIELWAKLLVSSSTSFQREYTLFIRILNELSSIEAKIFNYIAKSSIHDSYKGYISHMQDVSSDWSDTFVYNKLKGLLSEYNNIPIPEINFSEFENKLRSLHQQPGVFIYFLYVVTGEKNQHSYEYSLYDTPRCDFDDLVDPISISMLVSLGLIKNFESPEYWFNNVCFTLYSYVLTPLGASFYEACIDNKTQEPV